MFVLSAGMVTINVNAEVSVQLYQQKGLNRPADYYRQIVSSY